MKRWLAVGLLLLVVAVPAARADEATKHAKVEELFATMHMDRMMTQLMAGVRAQTMQMVKSMPGMKKITPQQQKLIDDYQSRVEKLVDENFGWKAMEPEFVTLYSQTYSEEEIDGILTFYKSPAGQAMLAKTPELTAKGMVISQRQMVAVQPQLNALMEDFIKQFAATMPPASSKPAVRKN